MERGHGYLSSPRHSWPQSRSGCNKLTMPVAGDNWICGQVKELLGDVPTVETKVGTGVAALGLHPEVVRERIRSTTTAALRDLGRFTPFEMAPPYEMVLKVRREKTPYPGAEKTAQGEFTFRSNDFLEVMDAFNKMK